MTIFLNKKIVSSLIFYMVLFPAYPTHPKQPPDNLDNLDPFQLGFWVQRQHRSDKKKNILQILVESLNISSFATADPCNCEDHD